MKCSSMKALACIAIASAGSIAAIPSVADSSPVVLDQLRFDTVHGVAERSILATDDAGRPAIVLLRLDDGDFLPPHGGVGGLRLLTVLSGELSWGDGTEVDVDRERVFQAGTMVVIPADGGDHWAAARNGDVLVQVVFIRGGRLAAAAAGEQVE